jgi:hypothetical protein
MDGPPPTPETSVSMFVWAFALLTALVVVLTLLVVRRRHRTLLSVTLGVVTLMILAAVGVYLIVPPMVPSGQQPQVWQRCPYDRLVWSNMRADVDPGWQICRRTARTELALMLTGSSVLTVGAAAAGLRLTGSRSRLAEPVEPVAAGAR